jgi:hypothetical protein
MLERIRIKKVRLNYNIDITKERWYDIMYGLTVLSGELEEIKVENCNLDDAKLDAILKGFRDA